MKSKGKLNILNVSKRYEIGEEKNTSLRTTLKRPFHFKKKKKKTFWALKNISIDINPGEVVGIIGKNGAGKSTLLKVLSKITAPTEGRIEISGRVASLLEVGTGFHPELTGRENIYLNGTILGMTKKEVKEKFDEIIEFSGIDEFIDTPVKKYSSGMYVRLAFSVAAHLEPEILVIDEVLAVGDAEFQNKCLGKMQDVASTGRTVLFVSHNLAAVKKLCTKGVLLEKGEIKIQGDINDVIQAYIKSGESSYIYQPEVVKSNVPVAFKSIELFDANQQYCSEFTCEDEVLIKFNFAINASPKPYSVFVIVKDKYDSPVFSAEQNIESEIITLKLEKRFLTRGRYQIHTFIHIPKLEQIDVAKDICGFTITDATSRLAIHGNYEYGNVFGNYKWIKE
jgi:lipopolysaccharide transport system ATP-binding protein